MGKNVGKTGKLYVILACCVYVSEKNSVVIIGWFGNIILNDDFTVGRADVILLCTLKKTAVIFAVFVYITGEIAKACLRRIA